MKVIFLDVDGVLNNDKTLMDDDSLDPECIATLAQLVNISCAKIVLSSSWKFSGNTIRRLMDAFAPFNMTIYSLTKDGVSFDWLKTTQWKDIEPCPQYNFDDELCFDRGAEIAEWLSRNEVEQFVILDDESNDIKKYFPDNLVKTNPSKGLTMNDIKKAFEILSKDK